MVEVRHYTDGAAPYVFWSRTNNTDKAITDIKFTMLAFDAEGKPLSLPWQIMDSSAGYTYDVLCCDKQITFENGEVWSNPNYDKWLETYMGQKIDVSVLANYYAE